ncbi:hypothetical protein DFP72DRAFT_887855 [Ephemerocybe angulata]|uniref:Uncharacterized protein n=1 Tax=Ephemerocybe angulata TaxID=980116 RepID=A0A8H6MAA4_9AGAR|nr:hypothetical protein DFP72DRAFT_887855 [Tulosesus angulatus]
MKDSPRYQRRTLVRDDHPSRHCGRRLRAWLGLCTWIQGRYLLDDRGFAIMEDGPRYPRRTLERDDHPSRHCGRRLRAWLGLCTWIQGHCVVPAVLNSRVYRTVLNNPTEGSNATSLPRSTAAGANGRGLVYALGFKVGILTVVLNSGVYWIGSNATSLPRLTAAGAYGRRLVYALGLQGQCSTGGLEFGSVLDGVYLAALRPELTGVASLMHLDPRSQVYRRWASLRLRT